MRRFENISDWVISSRASWEQEEGSTTRLSNPDRMKGPRARSLHKQEDIVWTAVKAADGRIKSRLIDSVVPVVKHNVQVYGYQIVDSSALVEAKVTLA